MIDSARVLQPLREAEDAVRRLGDYDSPEELARALDETWQAVERSLRLFLRADPAAPDSLRLAALSPAQLPVDQLLEALRRRELISLELAGTTHEFEQAAARARRGEVRAADADLAGRVVERLRTEVQAAGEAPVREAARNAAEARMLDEKAHSVPQPEPRVRPFTVIAAAVALLALVTLLVVLVVSLDSQMDDAIAAFEAQRLEAAESGFREVLQEAPDNITAHLYLGRIHRRQREYEEAAEHLRTASRLDRNDPDVLRELGYLFLDLGRPQAAAQHFRAALEAEPENTRNWIGLVRALRAAGDPGADELLRRAPPEVRAALARQP